MKTEYGLYTSTDWNRECNLLRDYLKYLSSLKSALDVIQIFKETSLLFGVDNPLSFDEWKIIYGYERKKSNV